MTIIKKICMGIVMTLALCNGVDSCALPTKREKFTAGLAVTAGSVALAVAACRLHGIANTMNENLIAGCFGKHAMAAKTVIYGASIVGSLYGTTIVGSFLGAAATAWFLKSAKSTLSDTTLGWMQRIGKTFEKSALFYSRTSMIMQGCRILVGCAKILPIICDLKAYVNVGAVAVGVASPGVACLGIKLMLDAYRGEGCEKSKSKSIGVTQSLKSPRVAKLFFPGTGSNDFPKKSRPYEPAK